MGKVMGLLKGKLQGRADMSEVSKLIREKLGKQAYKDLNSKFTIDTMIKKLEKFFLKF